MLCSTRYRTVSRTPDDIILDVRPRKIVQFVIGFSPGSTVTVAEFSSDLGIGSSLFAICRHKRNALTRIGTMTKGKSCPHLIFLTIFRMRMGQTVPTFSCLPSPTMNWPWLTDHLLTTYQPSTDHLPTSFLWCMHAACSRFPPDLLILNKTYLFICV